MKKYFYLAAVSAMMLTACSSDKDVLEPTPTPSTPTVVAQQQAVAFDTYLSGTTASTRTGAEGVMTTKNLQSANAGFGVFAYYHDNKTYATETPAENIPDFMYNEHIYWSGGWTYSPLKYWPNETANDSQDPAATIPDDRIDKLSFFAYAPYVSTGDGTGSDLATAGTIGSTPINAWTVASSYGITGVSKADVAGAPSVRWTSYYGQTGSKNTILDHNVDLLWGVAPKGMNYQAVNGKTVETTFGFPIKDLVKPDKDQKVKFLFQHALSRIGLTVVSAIDQIAAGDDGGKFDKNQTRVLIDEVIVWGNFGKEGVLNLQNSTANVANWSDVTTISDGSETNPLLLVNTTNGYLSPELRYPSGTITFASLEEGVMPNAKDLLAGSPDPSKKVSETATTLAFDWGKTYYKASSNDYVLADVTYTNSADLYTYDETKGKYTQVYKTTDTSVKLNGSSMKLYTLTTGSAITSGTALTSGTKYYNRTGSAGSYVYTLITSDGSETAGTDDYYLATGFSGSVITGIPAYGSAIYWTGLLPRYFMVIPSELPATESTKTSVSVKIKYHVITKDEKLNAGISDVTNEITKTEKFQFESGKSYNLKLILGLTSVKLDAVVGEWQVGDDAEIWVPQNVEP